MPEKFETLCINTLGGISAWNVDYQEVAACSAAVLSFSVTRKGNITAERRFCIKFCLFLARVEWWWNWIYIFFLSKINSRRKWDVTQIVKLSAECGKWLNDSCYIYIWNKRESAKLCWHLHINGIKKNF